MAQKKTWEAVRLRVSTTARARADVLQRAKAHEAAAKAVLRATGRTTGSGSDSDVDGEPCVVDY